MTNQMRSRILPDVKNTVPVGAQTTNAASVALTGSGATGRGSALEDRFFSVLTFQFLHVTSSNVI